jgi:hypothetical protein
MKLSVISVSILLTLGTTVSPSFSQEDAELGDYFGFENIEIIKIGDSAGPMYTGDINDDGLMDILVINNRKSRIDLLIQKHGVTPEDVVPVTRANEIPEHWRFKKERVMVSHKVSALAMYDFNYDGRTDIVYAGNPSNIVFLAQEPDGSFKKTRSHLVKLLGANRSGFTVTNIIGDDKPELLTIVQGNIQLFPLEHDSIGKPVVFATENRIAAFKLGDYDGNGSIDIAGILSDSSEPVRLWLAKEKEGSKTMGPQLSFEMLPLREFCAVELPNNEATRMAIIEKASRRIVLYKVEREAIDNTGDREASIEIYPFLGKGARKQLVTDANGDGLLDIIATNPSDNTIVIYEQVSGEGLSSGISSPTLSDVGSIAIGDIDMDGNDEFYVLSEDEGVVGRSPLTSLELKFPFHLRQ